MDSAPLADEINRLCQGKPIRACLEAILNVTYTVASVDPIMRKSVAGELLKLAERLMDEMNEPPSCEGDNGGQRGAGEAGQ